MHRGVLASTTSVMFLGDAWADWAWLGVIVFPFAMGFMVRMLDIKLIVRAGKSVGTIAALGLGHFGIFVALTRALESVLLTGGFLFLPAFAWLISGRARATTPGVPAPAVSTTAPDLTA